jgi:hypothetical protein
MTVMIKRFRLDRRTVLRGMGSIAIGLPWLECMTSEREAQAQTPTVAKRFIGVYQPGGTVMERFTPGGSEDAPVLSPILSPMESIKSKFNIVLGLNSDLKGEQHQKGICGLLTGVDQANGLADQFPRGPSLDQVIATRILPSKPIKSLEVAIRWATGKSHGRIHPINSMNFEDNANFTPISPRLDPQAIWDEIFGSLGGGVTPTNIEAIRIARKKSVLDFVDRKYAALAQRLGTEDRARLEDHLTKIRAIEGALVPPETTPDSCVPPELIDTSDYNPKSGLNADNDGQVRDTQTDTAIPKVGKFMMDMVVMAMACNRTSVATIQWTDTEAKHTFPWLNLPDHHHFYQHDGGFRAAECEKIATWYSEQHKYLLEKMQAQVVGPDNQTLLDESVVLFGSEIQKPDAHSTTNLPFLLAGNGGGMRTGRYLKYNAQPHNNLLVSVLNLFGSDATTFGNTRYETRPLNGPSLT